MPLLKQEFILRNEKLNYNYNNISKIIQENNTNKFCSNKYKININKYMVKESFIINKDKEYNNKDKTDGNIIIKTNNKNLYNLLYRIKKYLKKEGFVKFGGNTRKHEHNATNGDIDVFLHLQKYKSGYVDLNYSLKGPFQFFEKFQNILINIEHILEN